MLLCSSRRGFVSSALVHLPRPLSSSSYIDCHCPKGILTNVHPSRRSLNLLRVLSTRAQPDNELKVDNMARRLSRAYASSFEKRPIITLAVTNSVLNGLGDAAAQMIPILVRFLPFPFSFFPTLSIVPDVGLSQTERDRPSDVGLGADIAFSWLWRLYGPAIRFVLPRNFLLLPPRLDVRHLIHTNLDHVSFRAMEQVYRTPFSPPSRRSFLLIVIGAFGKDKSGRG
jgi:hypothetical protein